MLLEVLIAAALLVSIAAGAAPILGTAVRAMHEARVRTMASVHAAEKLEQLRSLTWTHVTTLDPEISMSSSDLTSDLSVDPASDGGPGLLPSPAGTLDADVDAYVDYLDGSGRIVSGRLPAAAVFIRRWAIRPLASDPDNVLVLTVVVTTRAAGGAVSPNAVRLVTIVARK